MDHVQRAPDLRTQVYERIRRNFAEGRYDRATVFTEQAVADEYGVSRTPVREALTMLARDGLLIQSGRSFRIPSYTAEEIGQVFEIRERLEPFAVRKATERASDAELSEFRMLAERELAEHSGEESYIHANGRIRHALFALARNRRLVEAIEAFEQLTAFIRHKTLRDPATRELSVHLNRDLVAAVTGRNALAAERAMHGILRAAQTAIITALVMDGGEPTGTRRRQIHRGDAP